MTATSRTTLDRVSMTASRNAACVSRCSLFVCMVLAVAFSTHLSAQDDVLAPMPGQNTPWQSANYAVGHELVFPGRDGRDTSAVQPNTGQPVPLGTLFNGEVCPDCQNQVCSCDLCDCNSFVCGVTTNPPWWIRGEFLGWTIKGDQLPALVTSSPVGTDPMLAGILGPPRRFVFGDDLVHSGMRPGGRVTAGIWLNECRDWGLQGDLFGLEGPNNDFLMESDGDPILARPFFNTDPGVNAPDAQLIALSGTNRGSIFIDNDGQVYSGSLALRRNTRCCTVTRFGRDINQRVDVIVGGRYLRFGETLNFTETLEPTGGFFAPGTFYRLNDHIEAANDFYGAELGVEFLRQKRRSVVELSARVAFGDMRRRLRATGATTVTVPGSPALATLPGGFHVPAQGFDEFDDEFSVIPQARIACGYFIRTNLQFHVAYDFMFITNIVRPSSGIRTSFPGTSLVSGLPSDNTLTFVNTNAWIQGISMGLTLNF